MNRRHLLKLLFAAPLAALVKPASQPPAKWVQNPEWETCQYRTAWVNIETLEQGEWKLHTQWCPDPNAISLWALDPELPLSA